MVPRVLATVCPFEMRYDLLVVFVIDTQGWRAFSGTVSVLFRPTDG
jgi:hypothetical protein